MDWRRFFNSLMAGAVWAAVGVAIAIPLFIWGSDKAPEFYGAFTAAIVAAIAVVLSAFYQADLTRRRDESLRKDTEVAQATDLYYWLRHAAEEMEFIGRILEGMKDALIERQQTELAMPLDQFREVVSAKFMSELRVRAAVAARLPFGAFVTPILYKTYATVDRVYLYRGAIGTYRPGIKQFENHIFITRRRIADLRESAALVAEYLVENGVLITDWSDPVLDDEES